MHPTGMYVYWNYWTDYAVLSMNRICGPVPGLTTVPVNAPKAVRPISMIRRRGRSLSVAADAMWEQLKAEHRQRSAMS